jgi:hypothetical protein
MKLLLALCLACLLPGAPPAAGGGPSPKKKAAADNGRAAAALDTIQKALKDLPPGAEVEQIRKALARLREAVVKDIQGRLSVAEADLQGWTERSLWSQRMLRKGLLSKVQAQADRDRVRAAEIRRQRLRDELKALGAPPP